MSAALREPPDLADAGQGGIIARRAVIRWAWRLFRREWRQQLLVVALLAVAVAAATIGVAAAASAPSDPNAATLGAASSGLVLPGSDPHLAADIAAIRHRYADGPVDVIENQTIAVPGSVGTINVRAQDPHGRYGQPMLSLVLGRYPAGPGEVAVTSGVAALFDLRIGDLWHEGGMVRLALRDLSRYRTRSGAALAAVTFAALLATLTCILATASYSTPLTFAGPNLAPNQLIVYEPHTLGQGSGYIQLGPAPPPAEQDALLAKVNALAASWHARFVLTLDSAGQAGSGPRQAADQGNQLATLWQAVSQGTVPRDQALLQDSANYAGTLYVATPALLRDFGIKPSQIGPDTDIVTSRAGLAAVPGLELLGQGDIVTHMNPPGHEVSETHLCPPPLAA